MNPAAKRRIRNILAGRMGRYIAAPAPRDDRIKGTLSLRYV